MLEWYCKWYRLEETDQSVFRLVGALGSFPDVAANPWLAGQLGDPGLFNTVAAYWRRRLGQIARRIL